MNNTSIIDSIRSQYIDENLESAKKVNYTDVASQEGVFTAFYDDLPDIEVEGYPFASDFVAADGTTYTVDQYGSLDKKTQAGCKLRYYYLPYSHELYIGTTGSGKTTGCVEPQLRAISRQKNKPNLFLTDPKGELFNRNAEHLREEGYRIFVLNFKNLIRSDRWNPLLEIYDARMEIVNIGKDVKVHKGKVKKGLEKVGAPSDYKDDTYIEYKGKAFPNKATYFEFLKFEKDFLEAQIDSLMSQLANMMIHVQSSVDRSWELGAQDLLKGLLHCMLDDAAAPNTTFTRDMMTFRTLQQYYLELRNPILSRDSDVTLHNHPLLKNKDRRIKALMATALDNAPNTMRSYCGVFDGAVKDWFQGHIFALTTGNTIDITGDDDRPYAIFLITRDYEKSDFLIAGLFIDWVYRQMLEKAEKDPTSRPLHFLLDEFGNIPHIKDLENKIATSRSRNIWFHLVVQSYMQIDIVYGADYSVVIRDNCNAQIFLGAQNRQTKEIFANECGKHYIPTLESKLDPNFNTITEAALVPVSDLDCIIPGQMYIKRLYMPVIMSQFIRSYIAAEQGSFGHWTDGNGLETCTPFVVESFTGDRYTFARLEQWHDEDDDDYKF